MPTAQPRRASTKWTPESVLSIGRVLLPERPSAVVARHDRPELAHHPEVVRIGVRDPVEVDVAGVDAGVERALRELHLRGTRIEVHVFPASSVWIIVPKSPAPWPRSRLANSSANTCRFDPVFASVHVAPPSVVP
jgi:hypothetical protein